jgi:hypothetical protein
VQVTEALYILCVVVVTALAFDFTNGFHDTANAMATSVATGALKPKAAVALSAILNLVGAFLSIQVALTVSNKIISIQGANGQPVPGLMGVPMLVIILAGAYRWHLVESVDLAGRFALVVIACADRCHDRCFGDERCQVGRRPHLDRVAGSLFASGGRRGCGARHLAGLQDCH